MALSTYNDLKSAVANWLHRSDLTSIIPDLILLGEKRLLREVRCREMEATLSSAISSGTLAVPADYLELKYARIMSSTPNQLQRTSATSLYQQYPLRSSSGIPKLIARDGDYFVFGPYPDSSYTVEGVYYASPTSIQTTANDLFVAHPDLYLYASLIEAAPYIQDDPRVGIWESKYQNVLSLIMSSEKREYSSGGGLAVTAC